MTKIYVIPIESIPTRYSEAWYTHIPKLLDAAGAEVVVIEGDEISPTTTPGAFLDFAATNAFKSSQLIVIAELFSTGKIQPGDVFLYTDAWNPTVTQLRYMSELFQIPIKIHALHHAGSWDKFDFLGRLIGDKLWIRNLEASLYYCYDTNWFATRFHSNMFCRELFDVEVMFEDDETAEMQVHDPNRIQLTGWPMEYLDEVLEPYKNLPKKNQIIFPHRIAPEKQLEIFKDLAKEMPEYNWVVCQEKKLSKHEYHTLLGESKICFSASLQETYGIAVIEAFKVGAIPLLPDRLSYNEIWNDFFKYPSDWTSNWNAYQKNKFNLISLIKDLMDKIDHNTHELESEIKKQNNKLLDYTNAKPLIDALTK